jgi:hypothetical protein
MFNTTDLETPAHVGRYLIRRVGSAVRPFNIRDLILCILRCVFVFDCVLFCVLFLLMYIAVSFLFAYKFTDHCHQVETQLQLIYIISYIFIELWGLINDYRHFTLTFSLDYKDR